MSAAADKEREHESTSIVTVDWHVTSADDRNTLQWLLFLVAGGFLRLWLPGDIIEHRPSTPLAARHCTVEGIAQGEALFWSPKRSRRLHLVESGCTAPLEYGEIPILHERLSSSLIVLTAPAELSREEFEEVVEVFRILKRWRDEARR